MTAFVSHIVVKRSFLPHCTGLQKNHYKLLRRCCPTHRVSYLCIMSSSQDAVVPDTSKRAFLNYVVLSTASWPVLHMLFTFFSFFYPASVGSPEETIARDILGNAIKKNEFIKTRKPETRELVQGPKGDPYYLMIDQNGQLLPYSLDAVCTHLGCVVPWEAASNQFICHCHGSHYDKTGKVVRGPAPLPLALAHVDVNEDDTVVLKKWKEEDFRTGSDPWWK